LQVPNDSLPTAHHWLDLPGSAAAATGDGDGLDSVIPPGTRSADPTEVKELAAVADSVTTSMCLSHFFSIRVTAAHFVMVSDYPVHLLTDHHSYSTVR